MSGATLCKYCAAPEPGAPSGLLALAAWPASRIYMLPDPRHPGRCVIASRVHVRELFDLDAPERHRFVDEVSAVARVVQEVLGADKMNLGFYGDIVDHLHAHAVPKFAGGPDSGAPFPLQAEAIAGAGARRGSMRACQIGRGARPRPPFRKPKSAS